MLQRSLLELAVGSFFSSPGLAKVLRNYLESYQNRDLLDTDGEVLREECYSTLVKSLDDSYPRRFRLNDVRHVFANFWHDELFSKPDLPVLDDLFKRLMLRNGDFVEYQDRQVQAYARLASEFDPALLVGWHLSGWLKELAPEQTSDVKRVISSQWPFFSPRPIDVHTYAEGHVHLGGATIDSIILSNEMLATKKLDSKSSATILRLRRILAVLFAFGGRSLPGTVLSSDQRDEYEIHKKIAQACKDLRDPASITELPADWILLRKIHGLSEPLSGNWLLGQLAGVMRAGPDTPPQTSNEAWLWLVVFLWHMYRQPETSIFVRVSIMYFFVELMSMRRQLIMEGQGLTRFTEHYFSNRLRRNGNHAALKDNFKLLMAAQSDVAETKGTPSLFQPDNIAQVVKTIAASQKKSVPGTKHAFGFYNFEQHGIAEKSYISTLEQWHFCGHFTRSADGLHGKKTTSQRAKANSSKLWKEATQLQHNLRQTSGWSQQAFLGGYLNPNFQFQPGRWFRGLDVAGDENA